MDTLRIPPHDLDIEMAVLGTLMVESDSYPKIATIINEDSFYDPKHRIIFESIKSLYNANKAIDMLTVTKYIRDIGRLDEIGGTYAITQMTSNIASSYHIGHHAMILQQKYIHRKLAQLAMVTADQAFDPSMDIDEVIGNLRYGLDKIDEYAIGNSEGHDMRTVIQTAVTELEQDCKDYRAGIETGITTGLQILNRATGGWRKQNLVLIASRPSVGKTSLALKFAKECAMSGKWVNFYGLEMKSSDLMRIMLSGDSEVNRTSIRDGKVTDEEWTHIDRSISRMEKLPIIWNDFAGITVNHIRANTERNVRRGKCDLVIVDYLQLVTPSNTKVSREQQVAEMSRTLKKLALSVDIPVIVLSQLNREASDGEPQLHHLRESGALEQDADVVIMPWVNADDQYLLSVRKNRRGITGTFEIGRNKEMTQFFDLPTDISPHFLIKQEKVAEPLKFDPDNMDVESIF